MGRSMVRKSPYIGRSSFSPTSHLPGRAIRAAIRHRATQRSEEALGAEERGQPPLSIVEAFLTNPVAFMAGAFVGLMELDVVGESSAIAKVLREDR